jgi:hypothetical protein
MEAGLGPLGLGRRHQLGHIEAMGRGLPDHGGGGVLVAVAGGRGHRQPQPIPGRGRPRWIRRPGWHEPVAVLLRWGLDGQVTLEAAQGLLARL